MLNTIITSIGIETIVSVILAPVISCALGIIKEIVVEKYKNSKKNVENKKDVQHVIVVKIQQPCRKKAKVRRIKR